MARWRSALGIAASYAGLLLSYHAELPRAPAIVLAWPGWPTSPRWLLGRRDSLLTRRWRLRRAPHRLNPTKHESTPLLTRRQVMTAACIGLALCVLRPLPRPRALLRVVASFSLLADMLREVAWQRRHRACW
jgi:hypothetical protein